MFLIKVVLGISCIIICSKIAINRVNLKKQSCLYFESLTKLCQELLSNIEYKKTSLLNFKLTNFTSTDFYETLNSFKENKEIFLPTYLVEEEKFNILSFFNELGKSDSNSQKLTLNFYKDYFLKVLTEKNNEYKKTYALTLKVGFSIGVMLFVLVI